MVVRSKRFQAFWVRGCSLASLLMAHPSLLAVVRNLAEAVVFLVEVVRRAVPEIQAATFLAAFPEVEAVAVGAASPASP